MLISPLIWLEIENCTYVDYGLIVYPLLCDDMPDVITVNIRRAISALIMVLATVAQQDVCQYGINNS